MMTQASIARPSEPLVERNPFCTRPRPELPPIPTFLEAKPYLPEPVVSQQPDWVEMYWRAWEMAWSHFSRPKRESGFVANYITGSDGSSVFMWDTALMVQFGLYGRRVLDFSSILNNFYAKQHDDGFICRQISTEDGSDFTTPFNPNSTGPNILAWAEWRYFRLTGDDSRLPDVFWPLMALHRWYRAHRTWPDGLYWATGLSSGMDNQPRVPDSMVHHRHWSWVDASVQAALDCLVLEQMATLLEQTDLAPELAEERLSLVQRINERLWNAEVNFYQDVDANGRFSPVKSIGAYWALLTNGLVSADRLDPFVQHLRDTWAFDLPHRVPSQSADSEGYNAQTGNMWRGAVWPATNFMVLKGLRATEHDSLAHEIALNHLGNLCEVFRRTDTFWQNYAPETAAPGAPAEDHAVGTAGLTPIAILLEEVIGVTVDWPLRRVVWDRRLESTAEYGVRRYPLGADGTLDLLGTPERVVVETDVPFTLTIRDRGQRLQTAVSTGITEIGLD